MKFKLHSNPILKDLANMAVLALKFYIPSQSRTPPVSQTRAAKALQDDVRELLVLLPPFPSQMRSESDIFRSGSQREDALRERKGTVNTTFQKNKTSFFSLNLEQNCYFRTSSCSARCLEGYEMRKRDTYPSV
jgi:hypothetical protein